MYIYIYLFLNMHVYIYILYTIRYIHVRKTYNNIPRLIESSQLLHQNGDESMALKVKIKSVQQIQSAIFFKRFKKKGHPVHIEINSGKTTSKIPPPCFKTNPTKRLPSFRSQDRKSNVTWAAEMTIALMVFTGTVLGPHIIEGFNIKRLMRIYSRFPTWWTQYENLILEDS